MKLSEELLYRGLVKDKTFSEISWLDSPKTFYLGADAGSANSLTVGNLAVFMLARRLLDAGWNTVLLMGGATSLIGDPGGKEAERELVSKQTIDDNVDGIRQQVTSLFSGKNFTLVNNYDWFKGMGYLEFLRVVGKQYSMTELTQRDFIADRMGEGGTGISYAEFSYTLIQGYDFYHLYNEHKVVLQIGGSDQWGNMLSGVPLIRKKNSAEVHAMSMPLVIDKTTGKKFGKSEAGAVWLDEAKTSVYQFYQFWLNSDDEGVIDYLKIYTLLTKEEIDSLEHEMKQNPSSRVAQKALAYEVTKLVHGQEKADQVIRVTSVLFGGINFKDLTDREVELLKQAIPYDEIDAPKISIIDILVFHKLAVSKSEARQFVSSGAISINGVKIESEKTFIDKDDIIHNYALIKKGKNNFLLVKALNI